MFQDMLVYFNQSYQRIRTPDICSIGMMTSLQELIDLALSDGTVSDIEMTMLRAKARELSVAENDLLRLIDERKKLGVGAGKAGLSKCPNCKEPVKEFAPYCEWCGASLAKVADRETITSFHQRVAAANPSDRPIMISSYPLPLAKQEIIELLSIAVPASKQMTRAESMSFVERRTMSGEVFSAQYTSMEQEARAWGIKANALISNSRVIFGADPSFVQQLEAFQIQLDANVNRRQIEADKQMKKGVKMLVYLGLIFVGFMIFVSIMAAFE